MQNIELKDEELKKLEIRMKNELTRFQIQLTLNIIALQIGLTAIAISAIKSYL